MGKILGSKCKLCRREGEKLMLKGDRCNTPKCAMVKRNYPPGVHGPKGRGRQSGYCLQLREKQKAKRIYNMMEKQFRLTFDKAYKQPGDAGENLLKMLETRFDNVIYRIGFASSRAQAREMVNHRHFTINGKGVDIPSYQVKTGDVVQIKKASANKKMFKNIKDRLKKVSAPGWLNLNIDDLSAKMLHLPGKDEVELKINTQIIVEFYSK